MSQALDEPVDDGVPAVAVVGMACRFPGADSVQEYWQLLRSGGEPGETVPDQELRGAGLPASLIDDPAYVAVRKRFADPALFDAGFFGLTPAEAEITDPQQRFLMETAVHALEHAAIDPDRFPGRIGVFLGLNHSDYLLENVLPHRDAVERLGWHRTLMGNDRGFTATQLAYRLGLTGPSLAVDCACSSSLAAVHQACRTLLDYEADAMVVGGSCIKPRDLGYLYTEGGTASPDGRCRPFSAEAAGTVFASGVGVVVLRRLEDALQDGDRVLAVIRAGAVNNDGTSKSGYTAPSAAGQAELIATVHALAGVTADTVSYVEAHGTGTALGDPIEVSALTEAFRETASDTGFCALGSVKSNIGHADSASGIAGLIKVVLALHNRELPPTLGCEEPNPHLDLPSSPFHINRELRPWQGEHPLRAGVSSFGIGGTNVHLLVEEAPQQPQAPAPAPADDSVLITFTAKSPQSLDALDTQLRKHLSNVTSVAAAHDVAFTLRRGRTQHPLHRALLWGPDGDVVRIGPKEPATPEARPVALLLDIPEPTADLLRDLCDTLPAFRTTAEPLLDAWRSGLGPGADTGLGALPRPVLATITTLGAAAVWRAYGIEPAAVLAASECRPAAAVLTGVLSVPELKRLLARLATGEPVETAALELTLGPAKLTWYDVDGSELVPVGRAADPAHLGASVSASPGLRTLPPRGLTVARPAVTPDAEPPSAAALGRLGRLVSTLPGVPDAVRPGADTLLAGVVGAWAAGVRGAILPQTDGGPGSVVDVPVYPFHRQRYWLEAQDAPSGAPAAEAVPAADLEEESRQLFRAAVGVDEVAAEDDLLTLGGDSLLAQRVVAAAKSRWGVVVPFGSFMRGPTPRRLAELVRAASPITTPAPDRPHGVLPLTPLQEKFVFLDEIDKAAEAYNVPVLADLRGPLDTTALHAALRDVVARHEALHSVYTVVDGRAVQQIRPSAEVDLPVVDVDGDPELRQRIGALLATKIPLDRAPVLLARIFRLAPERHVLAMAVHHICADARSTGILLADLYSAYAHRVRAEAPDLPPLDGLSAAYALAQAEALESADMRRHLEFWTGELADAPKVIELPADRPRASARSYAGRNLDFSLPAELATRVRELAVRERTTPFVVVSAAFSLFLGRISDIRDVVVGTPVSGRHRPETRDLIGNFVNTLPMRSRWDGDHTFRDLVHQTQERLTDALDHQDLPFEVLAQHLGADADLSVSPVFQVLFNMLSEEASAPPAPEGLRAVTVPFNREASTYELSLSWWLGRDGTLSGRFMYDSDRFDAETVAAWQEAFGHLLDQATRAPETLAADLPVETPEAAARTAAALVGPSAEVADKPVHAVFADLAARHPERTAVADKRITLTYAQLARISAGIAGLLTERGVTHGDTVGIAMERGVPLVAALMGVLRAGATPVPFDLGHPSKRLAAIAEDSGARVMLCADAADARFATGAEPLELADVTRIQGPEGPLPGDAVDLAVGAYVTYTSGTTGRPKGIHFTHRALANLADYDTRVTPLGTRWLQFASFGFDVSFHETFGALCSGGSLHVVDDEDKHDHELLPAFIRDHGVQKAIFPVSLMHALAARYQADPSLFASMREITTTGEQLRLSEQMIRFFESLPECRLINNYGPAETHCVAFYRFTGPPSTWPRYAPIGRPIQNVTYEIKDKAGRPVPYGSIGELFLSGPCVATGYLGRPELTAERFSTHPATGQRTYRSGDRVRLLHSGDLLYLGRGDQQVKIRGTRVELGEIELVIRRVPGVRDVYLRVTGESGHKRLDAYLIAAGRVENLPGTVRDRLREELPPALVPSSFTVVDAFPVNVNGKVDPSRLPDPGAVVARQPPDEVGTGDPVLTTILGVFRELLQEPQLRAEDDFFGAGGHSLLATRALHLVRETLGVRLSIRDFYATGTASALATIVTDRAARPDDAVILPASRVPDTVPGGLLRRVRNPGPAHQKTFVFRTGARLDLRRLNSALDAVLTRHPALRLRYPHGGGPVLAAPGESEVRVEELRLPTPPPAQGAPEWLSEMGQADLIDPRRDVLLRVRAVRLPEGGLLISFTVHAAALDGIGLLNLVRSIAEAYDTAPGAGPAEDPGFLRYLAWREDLPATPSFAQALDVWRELLPAPASNPVPPADPASGPMPPAAPVHRLSWRPDASLHAVIRSWCAARRTTPFLLHLTAFTSALARRTGEPEVCVSVALDGRVHSALSDSVGAFANVVPVPLRLGPEQSPAQAFEEVQRVQARVESVRLVPFGDLASQDPALAAYTSLPVSFTYVREDDRDVLLAGEAFEALELDTLPPGQRLQFLPVEAPDSLRVELLCRDEDGPGHAQELLRLYREAVFRLLFEPDSAPDLVALAPAGATA
ncbi:amino acid adenylation domain-containing protein [Streptomyces misionensis]|uniref:Amino acid adenylation domain-containing protein n=1 Tax=Streptomyces misionensis TaxID=67331 RepID=A0A5C6JZH9_9ACTN|nr:non-ribosomal peptide synthetase [Streptomyces misionensis]TWV53483.1 amino acid adenylation domain-containing protein [Streptomyces misionensis]